MIKPQDISKLKELKIAPEKIETQIYDLQHGYTFLKIDKAASVDEGIISLDDMARFQVIDVWKNFLGGDAEIVKFVPASGAASRMFKELFEFLDSDCQIIENDYVKRFFDNIEDFAFFDALNDACLVNYQMPVSELISEERYKDIICVLLYGEGLNYGFLPKGLLQFHVYEDHVRTAVLEHLVEGALYTVNKKKQVKIHFTVSPEHLKLFEDHIANERCSYEQEFGVKYNISFSEQKSCTDTVAIDSDGNLFRNADGSILFRPGGHGALIENLNDLDCDIVFIKNIDNVVPDRLKGITVEYKQVIAGVLVSAMKTVHGYMRELDGAVTRDRLEKMLNWCENTFNIRSVGTDNMSDDELVEYLRDKFNRPIRVCGMVKNVGEPGGGPYLTYNRDGSVSPQILETSQIDKKDQHAVVCMRDATHFNPVDLVCSVRDYKGNKFDLLKYVDPQTGFISEKSKNGVKIKVLELPGLWNGAMSDWNTIFVEVPIATFNPVKSVNDLLREQHR